MLFAGGIAVGLLSLVGVGEVHGPAAQASADPDRARRDGRGGSGGAARCAASQHWPAAKRLALLIAIGIGLHNFAEGLAIGQSAAKNDIALATLLVIGFGLHNATEGFGIVAPLAGTRLRDRAGGDVPARVGRSCCTMGLIGGGPTFVGTAVGHGFTSKAVSVAFLALAAGSIIYVVAQLFGIAARMKRMDLLAYGLCSGCSPDSSPTRS